MREPASDVSAAATPTGSDQQSRKRSREAPESSPLGRLLEQIRRLKLPCVDAATANRLLGPFLAQALKFDDGKGAGTAPGRRWLARTVGARRRGLPPRLPAGTLLGIVQQFGWENGSFCKGVDLGSFSLLLQVRGAHASTAHVAARGPIGQPARTKQLASRQTRLGRPATAGGVRSRSRARPSWRS